MRTRGEIEAAIREGLCRLEQEFMGRGPEDIHAHLIGDIVVVRLQGVLTAPERQLLKAQPSERSRDLVKQIRRRLFETARNHIESLVYDATGVKTVSLHHDVSTVTGEEVLMITLVKSPAVRPRKNNKDIISDARMTVQS